jgi:hypothetical protein
LHLTNDGALVAFCARDAAHLRDLWFGDLRTGAVSVVYQAPANSEIWWPQLAAGHLVWIEYHYHGAPGSSLPVDWTVRDMDLASRAVTVVDHDRMPKQGGHAYVSILRYDGERFAFGEALPDGHWQVEVRDTAGADRHSVAVSDSLYDVALVRDGVLFSSGVNEPTRDSIGKMHLDHWTLADGTHEVAADAFEVGGAGDLAAWVVDPKASQESSGAPQVPRLYVSRAPFTAAKPLSPVPDDKPTFDISWFSVAFDTIAWWETEENNTGGRFVLTVWRDGWQAPVQLLTDGYSPRVGARGGWLVWFEEIRDEGTLALPQRIRGLPLAALGSGRP